MNNNYLINDWYVNSGRDFGPRTIFAWYMAQTAKVISLPGTFFLHYLLYIFLIIYSSFRLSYLLFKNKFIALITSLTILFGTSITLGGNILVSNDFSAPQLPLGLSLLGIVLIIEKKYLLSAVIFAITSYLHPHFGFEGAVLFYGITIIIMIKSKGKIQNLITRTFLPYFLFTLPVIVLYTKEVLSNSVSGIDKLNILAYMRNSHHYVPSTWTIYNYVQFIVFLSIFVLIIIFFKKRFKSFLLNFFLLSTLVIIILCFLGFFFTEIYPLYFITALQPFRLTLYLYWIGIIIIIGTSLSLALEKKYIYSPLLLIPIFISNLRPPNLTSKTHFLAFLIACFLIIFFYKIPKKIFILFLLAYYSLFRYHDIFNFSSYIYFPTEETNLALWAKANTPPDSVFLIPPKFEKFRLIANRAIVVDWKAFPFQEKAMLEWAKRICTIGNIPNCNFRYITMQKVIDGYYEEKAEQILKLRQKYNFNYFISDRYYPELPSIYNNRHYVYTFPDKTD
jgi:hypothetical protein